MALGQKLWDEKGKYTMAFIEEIKMGGMLMKQSFMSEFKGSGKFPGGKNMASGDLWASPDGKLKGWWRGMMMTSDGEAIVWKASGNGKGSPNEYKGILIATFMTQSEKYSWLNSTIAILEVQGNMESFTDSGFEWI